MNIVQLQNDLKDLSDNQLQQTMMSGTSPQFLVLSEMQRRKQMRDKPQNQGPAPGTSVAEELMGGLAQLPSNINPPQGGVSQFAGGGAVAAERRYAKGENDAAYDNPWTGKKERPPAEPDVRKPRKYQKGGLIEKAEGFSAKAYPDAGGWSIGFGTPSQEGEVIDEAEARRRMKEHIDKAEQAIDRLVTTDLSPNQREAVASLIYNIGPTAFAESKARDALNNGDIETFIHEAFDPEVGFVHTGGKKSPGLMKRRAMEREHFSQSPESGDFLPERPSFEVASNDDAGIAALMGGMGGASEGVDSASGAARYVSPVGKAKPEFEVAEGTPHPAYDYTMVTANNYGDAEPVTEPAGQDLENMVSGQTLARSDWPDEVFKRRLQGQNFADGGSVFSSGSKAMDDFYNLTGRGVSTYLLNEDGTRRPPHTASSLAAEGSDGSKVSPRMKKAKELEAARRRDIEETLGTTPPRTEGVLTRRGVRGHPSPVQFDMASGIESRGGQMGRNGQTQGEPVAPQMAAAAPGELGMPAPLPPYADQDLPGTQVGGNINYPADPLTPGQLAGMTTPQQPEIQDPYIAYLREQMDKSRSNKLADFLMQSGIGMMASNKPSTLQNMGIGAQQGLAGLAATQKAEAARQQMLMEQEGAYRRGEMVANARGSAIADQLKDLNSQITTSRDKLGKLLDDAIKTDVTAFLNPEAAKAKALQNNPNLAGLAAQIAELERQRAAITGVSPQQSVQSGQTGGFNPNNLSNVGPA